MTRMQAFVLSLTLVAVAACGGTLPTGDGGSDVGNDAGPTPTYWEAVAPILYSNCVDCHRAGGIGPFPLVSYQDATRVAPLLAQVTRDRTMPPTQVNASGNCNTYDRNVRWLTDAQINTIGAWVAGGRPEGNPANAPALPPPPSGLPRTDTTLDMGVSYTPNATVQDDYRCFIVDPGFTANQFVTGYEVVPGDQRVVHHVILYSLPSDASEAAAQARDTADPLPGYECFGGVGVNDTAPLALWAPGAGATVFPTNTGLRMNAGRRAVIQIHYNLANGTFPDRTSVRLMTSATVQREAQLLGVRNGNLNLAPRMTYVESTATVNLPRLPRGAQGLIYGVAPHMHTLGRTLNVTATTPTGENVCLVQVPNWNFHWQALHFYAQPVSLDAASSLRITCGYDTSTRDTVTNWGEGTQDEMCINYLYVTLAQ